MDSKKVFLSQPTTKLSKILITSIILVILTELTWEYLGIQFEIKPLCLLYFSFYEILVNIIPTKTKKPKLSRLTLFICDPDGIIT